MVRSRRKRKAELASQIFVYILGVVVVGLILLLGARAVGILGEKKCTVQDASFQTELKAKIDSNKARGIISIETFTPSCGVTQVCFVSRHLVDLFDGTQSVTGTDLDPALNSGISKYQFIVDSVVSGEDTNVFVLTDEGYEPLGQFDKAAPIELASASGEDPGPITCISGEPLRMKFLGQGQVVDVEQP